MRLLLANQYFPPDASATAKLAESAVAEAGDRGHEVTVLSGRPSYSPTQRQAWRPVRRLPGPNRSRVVQIGSTAFDRKSMGGRVANYLSYCGGALPATLTARVDAVVAMTDPPLTGMVAAAAAKTRGRPFVYWVQDLHPDVAVAAGLLSSEWVVTGWKRAHAAVLRAADRVVVLGDDMADRVLVAGASPGSVRVVHNGAPIGPEPVTADGQHPIARRLRGSYEFVAVHAGNLGFAGAWDTLLEAARRLGCGSGMVFVGGGAQGVELRRRAEGIEAVAFHDPLPAADVKWVMAAGDLHIVTLRRGLEGLIVPSKLYGVLAAGRPVLVVADETSEAARLVHRHGCGLTADPDRPDAVVDAIAWACGHPAELSAMGTRAREAARGYDRALTMSQFINVVEEAAGLAPAQTNGVGNS